MKNTGATGYIMHPRDNSSGKKVKEEEIQAIRTEKKCKKSEMRNLIKEITKGKVLNRDRKY